VTNIWHRKNCIKYLFLRAAFDHYMFGGFPLFLLGGWQRAVDPFDGAASAHQLTKKERKKERSEKERKYKEVNKTRKCAKNQSRGVFQPCAPPPFPSQYPSHTHSLSNHTSTLHACHHHLSSLPAAKTACRLRLSLCSLQCPPLLQLVSLSTSRPP